MSIEKKTGNGNYAERKWRTGEGGQQQRAKFVQHHLSHCWRWTQLLSKCKKSVCERDAAGWLVSYSLQVTQHRVFALVSFWLMSTLNGAVQANAHCVFIREQYTSDLWTRSILVQLKKRPLSNWTLTLLRGLIVCSMAVPFVEDWDVVQILGEGAYGE